MADREAQDRQLQEHLGECVECWEALAEQEERHGIDLGLPPHPETTSEHARQVHNAASADATQPSTREE